jgi:transcriptional regulator with XRE-family HTH domain
MTFHEKLQALRKQRALSQAELGKAIGRLQGRIHKWEQGEGTPPPVTLLQLADFFSVPLRYLCDDRLDSPDAALAGEPSLTESERRIWSLVQVLGAERAIARLAQMPEPPAPAPAAVPSEPIPTKVPGRAKTLATVRVAKQKVPDGPRKKATGR